MSSPNTPAATSVVLAPKAAAADPVSVNETGRTPHDIGNQHHSASFNPVADNPAEQLKRDVRQGHGDTDK